MLLFRENLPICTKSETADCLKRQQSLFLILLILLLPSVAALLTVVSAAFTGYFIAVEGFDVFVLLVTQPNLDVTGQGTGFHHDTGAFRGFYNRIHRGGAADFFFVGFMFIPQTAHETSAGTGNFRGIERKILFLRHFDGNLYKVGEEA